MPAPSSGYCGSVTSTKLCREYKNECHRIGCLVPTNSHGCSWLVVLYESRSFIPEVQNPPDFCVVPCINSFLSRLSYFTYVMSGPGFVFSRTSFSFEREAVKSLFLLGCCPLCEVNSWDIPSHPQKFSHFTVEVHLVLICAMLFIFDRWRKWGRKGVSTCTGPHNQHLSWNVQTDLLTESQHSLSTIHLATIDASKLRVFL